MKKPPPGFYLVEKWYVHAGSSAEGAVLVVHLKKVKTLGKDGGEFLQWHLMGPFCTEDAGNISENVVYEVGRDSKLIPISEAQYNCLCNIFLKGFD